MSVCSGLFHQSQAVTIMVITRAAADRREKSFIVRIVTLKAITGKQPRWPIMTVAQEEIANELMVSIAYDTLTRTIKLDLKTRT